MYTLSLILPEQSPPKSHACERTPLPEEIGREVDAGASMAGGGAGAPAVSEGRALCLVSISSKSGRVEKHFRLCAAVGGHLKKICRENGRCPRTVGAVFILKLDGQVKL